MGDRPILPHLLRELLLDPECLVRRLKDQKPHRSESPPVQEQVQGQKKEMKGRRRDNHLGWKSSERRLQADAEQKQSVLAARETNPRPLEF